MHAELQLDNQICFRLYTAARLVTQAYTPMLTELGITYPQYLVLMVLWEKDSDIKWNFTKFLISKDGETIKRYAPTTEPKDVEKDVEAMLA